MRKVYSLDYGWKFKKESEIVSDYVEDYFGMFNQNTKTGSMSGPASASFYDENWENVNLPHDWPLGLPPSEKGSSGQGYKQQGIVWYRKSFTAPESWNGKRILLKFDGIAINSRIYLNDIKIAVSESCYTQIIVDITDFLFYDNHNVLSVCADNRIKEGWWYEGGGIYRHAHLIVTENDYFKEDGIFVHTEKINDTQWKLTVESSVSAENGCIAKTVFDGNEYQTEAADKTVQEISVDSPLLWDLESPNLYEIKSQLIKDGVIVDEISTKFGFREIKFDAENGLFLNGKNIKLKGVCMHHDHACVGAAIPDEIHEYRINRLKSMGCNAIRTSHNPQSPEFYAACDKLGMLVMNEARHFSSTTECLHQLEEFVKRDRNHPSVIMWSIYNEEPLQDTPTGERIARSMKKLIRALDPSRPVTGAMNGGPFGGDGVVKCVDIFGMNYLQYTYDKFHEAFPDIPLFGSENASYLGTRGITDKNSETHALCSGRVLGAEIPNCNLLQWSATPGQTWKAAAEHDFVAGIFSWTGMDYRGECGKWPRLVCNFGAMDLCGFPKDTYYWYKVLWSDEYTAFLSPHWNFKDGETARITCYTNADEFELKLNGNPLLKHKNDKYDPEIFEIPFIPGTLEAICYADGIEVCRTEISTASKAAEIAAEVYDYSSVSAVNVFLKDKCGNMLGTSSEKVEFEISGGGKIMGVGNGSNTNHYCETGNEIDLFGGLCQTIIEKDGSGSDIFLKIKTCGMEKTVLIKGNSADKMPYIPSVKCRFPINKWRKTDVLDYYPKDKLTDLMFAWIPANIAKGSNFYIENEKGFCFAAAAYILTNEYSENAKLHIDGFSGDADIYINNKLRLTVTKYGDIEIPLNKEDFGVRSCLTVVFRLNGGKCGISGDTYITF